MNEQELRNLYWKNAEMIDRLARLVRLARQQNVPQLNKQIPAVARELQQNLSEVLNQMVLLTECGLAWGEDYLVSILSSLEQAQLQEDYILLGDFYELQLIPALQDIQVIISALDISLTESSWWEGNREVLRVKNPELVQILDKFEKGAIQGQAEQYFIESTSTGFFTIALEEEGKRRYLHSNRNPLEEARIWAERNYQLEKEKYTLLGWGMGYHVRELLNLYSDMDLVVVEPDIGILYYSLQYGDWRSVLEKITLVWDPEYQEIGALISAEREMLLYRPAIAHVKEQRLRRLMNQIADRKAAIADAEIYFYQNIRENLQNCSFYVDEIRTRIKGKRVIIVAGGPSLDKNIEQLRERPDDVVVFAVGTVYKLLVKKKIPIDYVVISDLWVYHQVEGIEGLEVPVLLLATADRRISRYYQGRTYLVCQQGHKMAADYAKENGCTCYSSGGSVATLALDIAIRLEAAAIAFVGLDLAYYGTQMHASGTKRAVFRGYEYQKEKAWDGKELNTSQTFLRFRNWMEERIRESDATMKVVDATEGGIVKKGFVPMTLKQFLYEDAARK
ncbi:MAG: DUF115 domain-containing protein [Bacteroides sp.]|nr:DUF115 domain-containing protein [Bacteroides sp.]MCM1549036.1 DUF115 domain-containing protein [Clostridium sp.]